VFLADGVNEGGLDRRDETKHHKKCAGQPVFRVGRLVLKAAEVVGSLHDYPLPSHVISIAHIRSLVVINMPHDLSYLSSTFDSDGHFAVKTSVVPVHFREGQDFLGELMH
jgi:hypothetical protein